MRLLFILGWRNIFRNKRRTFLTSIVIGIGLASLIFQNALFLGMMENLVNRATKTFLGQAQIHAPGFRQTLEGENIIHHITDLQAFLSQHQDVADYSVRAVSPAMLTSPKNVTSVILYGLDPRQEQQISTLLDTIISGRAFSYNEQHAIVIGSKLAELLDVLQGDRIVATVAQVGTGDLSQELFRVAGIFHMGDTLLDKNIACIPLSVAQTMLSIGNGVHEIALSFKEREMATQKGSPFWTEASQWGDEVLSWQEIIPSLQALFDLADFSTIIIGVILLILVIFIIMDAFFMAIFERMPEFGVLRAIGMRPQQLFLLIVMEAVCLAFVSVLIGMAIGAVTTSIVNIYGIDYAGIDVAGVTLADPIYPLLHWKQFTYYPIAVFLFVVIVSLYPAAIAARIVPVEAMKQKG